MSHTYTHLGFLEGPEMQGRTRDVADGCKVSKNLEEILGVILTF